MRRRRIYLVTGCGGVALIIGLLLWPIIDSLMPHWPLISDRVKMRREATALYQQYQSEGSVPRSQWPEQIAALQPFLVTVYNGKVEIMISGGGPGGAPWGYDVWPDNVQRTDDGIVKYYPNDPRNKYLK